MTAAATNTSAWIEPFRKILELERANGFNDRAVSGGMDRFVQHWAEEMTAYLGKSRQSDTLTRPGYSSMQPADRAKWADRWRTLLDGDQPASPTNKETAPQAIPSTPRASPRSATETPRKAPRSHSRSRPESPPATINLDSPVTGLKRVDAKLATRLARLDVATVRDLLYLFPRRHLDYSVKAKIAELSYGQERTVEGEITEAREVRLGQRRGPVRTEAVLSDDTGNIRITWFGQTYLAHTLKPGVRIAVSGKVDEFQGRLVFESPEYEILRHGQPAIHTGRLLPVYPLTAGLTGRNLRSLTWQTLEGWLGGIEEYLPPALLARTGLMALPEAIRQAHYPDDLGKWASARRRLAFDELLTLQLSVLARRQRDNQLVEGVPR